jgi:glycosyltransferase involved in cell wall biosynthesis
MASRSDLVSVVIPAYNATHFVREAIDSVLGQSHSGLELIVVDDGSTDGTLEVARSVRDARLIILSGPNQGVAAARNKGLDRASGHVVAFLDADDCWDERKLELQLPLLLERSEVVAVGSLMRYISRTGRVLGTSGQALSENDKQMVADARGMPFPISSILFRREEVASLGGFDEELARHIPGLVEDLDLLSRLTDLGEIECFPGILGSYRIHGGAASTMHLASQRMGGKFLEARRAAERRGGTVSWAEFSEQYRPSLRERRLIRANAAYRSAGTEVAEGRWLRAVGHAILACVFGARFTFRRLRRQRPWGSRFPVPRDKGRQRDHRHK